jgi:nucleoside-diphosphate-sugar epimerase
MRSALVCGAGGFIGGHLVKQLKAEGFLVRGVDLKRHEYAETEADDFLIGDLRDPYFCSHVVDRRFDEVYQLAADMGGAGYIFTGEHDSDIMHNSGMINLNVLEACRRRLVRRIFYSSSACIYPAYNQVDPDSPNCEEASAYPAAPDSEYGWEKLFSERLYMSYARCHGMETRIARYHNIFGPEGTWDGGREKAPAAICRKVASTPNGGSIDIWGDGLQTRSFLYVSECIEGTLRLMRSNYTSPVNVGSEEMVSINDLADMAMAIAGKRLEKRHIPGPVGVRGRNSDNRLIRRELGWAPSQSLYDGLETTYRWIETQTRSNSSAMRAGVTHHVAAQRILPLRPASHEHADADINLAAIRPHPVAELAANRF